MVIGKNVKFQFICKLEKNKKYYKLFSSIMQFWFMSDFSSIKLQKNLKKKISKHTIIAQTSLQFIIFIHICIILFYFGCTLR